MAATENNEEQFNFQEDESNRVERCREFLKSWFYRVWMNEWYRTGFLMLVIACLIGRISYLETSMYTEDQLKEKIKLQEITAQQNCNEQKLQLRESCNVEKDKIKEDQKEICVKEKQKLISSETTVCNSEKSKIKDDEKKECNIQKGQLQNDLTEKSHMERREFERNQTVICDNEKLQQQRAMTDNFNIILAAKDTVLDDVRTSCQNRLKWAHDTAIGLEQDLQRHQTREANRGFMDNLGGLIKNLADGIQSLAPTKFLGFDI